MSLFEHRDPPLQKLGWIAWWIFWAAIIPCFALTLIVAGVLLIGPEEFIPYRYVGGGFLIGAGIESVILWRQVIVHRRTVERNEAVSEFALHRTWGAEVTGRPQRTSTRRIRELSSKVGDDESTLSWRAS